MIDDDLRDFLARAANLSPEPPGPGAPTANPLGDHDLDPEGIAVIPAEPHRAAAVLVPVVARQEGLSLLFTVRSAHLRDHSGQIAFPGGKIDAGDASPAAAALREAREEIGLEASCVRVLGYLDPYLSATGFLVTPVLGLVAEQARFAPNPDEVADLFEAPLAILLEAGRRRIETATWQGRTRRYYVIPYGPHRIWGVTAGIVNNLHERLFPMA